MKFDKKTICIFASALCLSLFVLQYGCTHMDSIMAARGDYYFKKQDNNKAEKFYEAAFDLGINDVGRRENYVNIIINSPLTINAQEKLVKFINYPNDDSAKLKAEYFLYDIKREIFRKYPGNYVKKAVYNGKIVHWGKTPITYGFSSEEIVPEYFIKEIEDAFGTWEKSLNQMLYFERVSKDPDIIITFESNNFAEDSDKKYVVAYTVPKINSEDKLVNSHISFYIKDSKGKYFSANQVYNTALHEIVHALGFMGHSENRDDIMYMSKDSKTLYKDERVKLTTADINTVKLLYTIKPDITNADDFKYEYIPYVVMGNNTEVTNSKIRDAKEYIKNAPYLPMGYIDLAIGYVAAQDYQKAIKNLEKAIELADNEQILDIIYYNLAVSYFSIDDLSSAKNCIKKSIAIKDTEEKRFLLAEIYLKRGEEERAIDEYGTLIKQHPKNIEYTIALTNIYVKNRNYGQARRVLKAYFEANPEERKNPRLAPYGIIRLGL